jgi:hypothetical protein
MHWKVLAPWAMGWMWCVVAFAMISAADYFRKFWRKVSDEIKLRGRRELLQLERERTREARVEMRRARASAADREL